jgi:hypothetical protein
MFVYSVSIRGGFIYLTGLRVNLLQIQIYCYKANCTTDKTLHRHKLVFLILNRSHGSSGSIVSDYGLDDRGSISGRGKGFFF